MPGHLQVVSSGRAAANGGAAGAKGADDGGGRSVNVEAGAPFCPEPIRENRDAQAIWDRLVVLTVAQGDAR